MVFCTLTLLTSIAKGQSTSPGFVHPLGIPVEVSGNFMELRTNHFHSGLDLKTNGRIGLPVSATADGWVSRIKISPWGYGKAVYIDHPSGYTTVYGHLDRLAGRLADTLLTLQYTARSFSVDHHFKRNELPVAQGEVIAFSGNTGGSSAPHLHYEVRRTSDQHALDPEAYGLKTMDRVPPTFTGLRLYPLDSTSRTAPYPAGSAGFPATEQTDSTFVLKDSATPLAFGTVGLAVNTFDRYSNSTNICGIRKLMVRVDGRTVCSIGLNEVDFGVQRYVNAYTDYGLFKQKGMHYNRCYKLPNNRLDVYGGEASPGRITVVPGRDHAVEVEATDASGNRSTLRFTLRGATATEARQWPKALAQGRLVPFDRSQVIEEAEIRFSLPPNSLYEDTYIQVSRKQAPAQARSPLFEIGDETIPLNLSAELSLEVTEPVAPAHTGNLLLVRLVKGKPVAEGGTWAAGRVTAGIRTLGSYTVMLDTTPPVLTPIGLAPAMRGRRSFKVRVQDDLSGVDQWHARLDGKWILMEYEPKSHTLVHSFDRYSDTPGEHRFELEVSDERGNRSRLTRSFTR